ncbi:MAG: peptidylprolyl isomerase [Bacteroidia bacterium]|nr:peptidylprolyl isomerase [Bacteroidia bacterium]
MKKTAVLLGFLSCISTTGVLAQKPVKKITEKTTVVAEPVKNNPYIFSIATDTVYKEEFMRQLNKNRKDKNTPTETELREYLDLYINFKLKVKEAVAMRLDTNPNFRSELMGYRKQLAAPYLTDKKVSETLMQEAYDRMKTEVNASHILINVAPNASPADTLAAFNKISDIRKRALKGEIFDSLATLYSEDPSAKKGFGKLGWFTAFQMVYPFENMAYKTPKGEISQPFRTQFGYHIMKVNDSRPSRGEIKIQHIMVRTGYGASSEILTAAKEKIDAAYTALQGGEAFESVVEKYSQDDGSKSNKGNMNWMPSLSGYPDDFKDKAFALKKDELSKPFSTDYGWHIIKYIDYRPLGEFKDNQDVIKNKVSRDSRAEGSKTAVIARVKKENNYKEYSANLKEFTSKLDSSYLKGNWIYDSTKTSGKPLFSIGDKTYTEKDFGAYLAVNQTPHEKENAAMAAKTQFNNWAADKCLAYEESILEKKFPDFNNIMQEYHDGILLFDLTDKKVWSKALSDTAGLEQYYLPNNAKYMWKERLKYDTYFCKDAKTKELAIKMFKSGKTEDEVIKKINKKVAGSISVKETKAEQSDAIAAKLWNLKGVVNIDEPDAFKFYLVNGMVSPEPKTLKEGKGLVTSDYQEYLMKEWVKELRSKYAVNVNEQALTDLYK